MKTSKLKGRRMWALYTSLGYAIVYENLVSCPREEEAAPVAVVPLNDPVALVDLAATAIAKQNGYGAEYAPKFWLTASAVLTAIGVLPKQRKGLK